MSPVGFEPTISAGERPQTYALDLEATVTGCKKGLLIIIIIIIIVVIVIIINIVVRDSLRLRLVLFSNHITGF